MGIVENKWRHGLVFIFLFLAAFFLFRGPSIDLLTAKVFFHPENTKNPWFEAHYQPWKFFYYAAPWMTGILLLGGILGMLLSQWPVSEKIKKIVPGIIHWRPYAIYIFLTIALGPGLFINSFFKPYWGRPRPREVIELGGRYEYRPFYSPSFGQPGKSFPCGHCSVGFSYGVFWFIFRKKKPWLAWTSLVGSTALGFLMGVGRIADGGHFLSDVAWAGIITWFSSFLIYHFILRVPQRRAFPSAEVPPEKGSRKLVPFFFYSTLAFLTLGALLLASPFHKELEKSGPSGPVEELQIEIDYGTVSVFLDDSLKEAYSFSGQAKGFGFPGNRVDFFCKRGLGKEDCRIHREGFFSDYETSIRIIINQKLVSRLRLHLKNGTLSVPDQMPPLYQTSSPRDD